MMATDDSDSYYRLPDAVFEVREGSLVLIIDDAVRKARRTTWPARIAQMSGGAFLALLTSFVSTGSYRGVLGISSEAVAGAIGTMTAIMGLAFFVSLVVAVSRRDESAKNPHEIVEGLKNKINEGPGGPDLLIQAAEVAEQAPKLAQKPSRIESDLRGMLNALAQAQGVLTVSRLKACLRIDEKTLSRILRDAQLDDFVERRAQAVILTAEGNRYLAAAEHDQARRRFFGSNVLEDAERE